MIEINSWDEVIGIIVGAIIMSPMIIAAYYNGKNNKKGGT